MSTEREADEGVEVVEVDARGLRCPIPVIRLGAAIRDRAGGVAGPAARDRPGGPVRRGRVLPDAGHELVETTDEPDHTAYLVRN